MTKYRIVEVKKSELSMTDGTVDFVPEIQYWYEYHIQQQEEVFFGLIKRWHTLWPAFNSLKRAERQIEFYLERESREIVKQY